MCQGVVLKRATAIYQVVKETKPFRSIGMSWRLWPSKVVNLKSEVFNCIPFSAKESPTFSLVLW